MKSEKHIPVGTMCAMFGLNPNTVRTWERRYQFPSPVRSAGGHRTYTNSDIELIGRIVTLINRGIAPVDAVKQAREAGSSHSTQDKATADLAFKDEIIDAISSHDQSLLRQIVHEAATQLGYRSFVEDLAFPLLVNLGHAWENTGEGVAEEHSFSLLVEGILLEKARTIPAPKSAPVVTFACVPNELHQMPLLHLANLAAEHSVARPLVLAAGLPISEILTASKRAGAHVIVLSATIAPASADTRRWMGQCVDAGWSDRVVLAGPGFVRSRVYAGYPVRAAVGGFIQSLEAIKTVLQTEN